MAAPKIVRYSSIGSSTNNEMMNVVSGYRVGGETIWSSESSNTLDGDRLNWNNVSITTGWIYTGTTVVFKPSRTVPNDDAPVDTVEERLPAPAPAKQRAFPRRRRHA